MGPAGARQMEACRGRNMVPSWLIKRRQKQCRQCWRAGARSQSYLAKRPSIATRAPAVCSTSEPSRAEPRRAAPPGNSLSEPPAAGPEARHVGPSEHVLEDRNPLEARLCDANV